MDNQDFSKDAETKIIENSHFAINKNLTSQK
jgi:hypothetical protein